MAKNYFAILGIPSNSTADELWRAYRRLSKAYHPDHYAGDSKLFRQIQEAYSALGAAYKCRQYEKTETNSATAAAPRKNVYLEPEPLIPQQGFTTVRPKSPLQFLHALSPAPDRWFELPWSNFTTPSRPGHNHTRELKFVVMLTPNQARHGGSLKITVPTQWACPTCRGLGPVVRYGCPRCASAGEISGELPISVSIPPGIESGQRIRIPLGRFGISHTHLTLHFQHTD